MRAEGYRGWVGRAGYSKLVVLMPDQPMNHSSPRITAGEFGNVRNDWMHHRKETQGQRQEDMENIYTTSGPYHTEVVHMSRYS